MLNKSSQFDNGKDLLKILYGNMITPLPRLCSIDNLELLTLYLYLYLYLYLCLYLYLYPNPNPLQAVHCIPGQ